MEPTTEKQKSARERETPVSAPYLPTVWAHLSRLEHKCALIFFLEETSMKKVGIIMGSDSDLPIVRKAMDTLTAFGVPFEVHIYSAHRTPDEAGVFAARAREDGFGVLICAAGMAAHLAGAIAARTSLPVIGIPCKSVSLDGMDALLSTVQMPTVASNGAANAALLAIQMLGIEDATLAAKLDEKKAKDAAAVLAKDAALQAELNG